MKTGLIICIFSCFISSNLFAKSFNIDQFKMIQKELEVSSAKLLIDVDSLNREKDSTDINIVYAFRIALAVMMYDEEDVESVKSLVRIELPSFDEYLSKLEMYTLWKTDSEFTSPSSCGI